MTASTRVVTWRRESPGIWVVTLDRPPANALGVPILEGLHAAIDAAERAGDVKVMIVTSALDGFFAAGADIKHMSSIDADSFMAYGDKMRAVNDRLSLEREGFVLLQRPTAAKDLYDEAEIRRASCRERV